MSNNPELDKKIIKDKEDDITIKLPLNDLNIVLLGLQELPHKVSHKIIMEIMKQAQTQVKE
jgi:hypothetical protein